MDCQDGAGPSDIARYARSLSHRSKICRQWWPKQDGWTMVGRQRSRGGGQMDVASYLLNIAVSDDGRLIACSRRCLRPLVLLVSTWERNLPTTSEMADCSSTCMTVSSPYNGPTMVNRSYHTGKIKCFHVSESLLSQWTEWNIRTNNRPASMPEQPEATDRETTRRQQVFFSPYFCAYDAPADKCACNATTQTKASATHPTISVETGHCTPTQC